MRDKRTPPHQAAGTPRPRRRIHEERPGKLPEGARCPRCQASYRNGRWTWQRVGGDAYERVCPACERIASGHPAGVIHLAGGFARSHRDELLHLLRNIEQRERAEHPLKRIIAIENEDEGYAVTVTDAKLAESFGRALQSAYEGRLEHPPTTAEQQHLVRARWTRD